MRLKSAGWNTIEFENGYVFQWPTDEVDCDQRAFILWGMWFQNQMVMGMFNNTIEASFRFVEGAQVTFEDPVV